MLNWIDYADALITEYEQCTEEGLDVQPYKAMFSCVHDMAPGEERTALADSLFKLISSLRTVDDYSYIEPSRLDEIKLQRPKTDMSFKNTLSDDELFDRLYGAWLGRVCGCLVGKPIEGIRTPDFEKILRNSNNYPMARYLCTKDFDGISDTALTAWLTRDGFADRLGGAAPCDDDTNYTVLALKLIKEAGKSFTPQDVMDRWLSDLPAVVTCTAERVAYKNALNCLIPPETATYKNPFREWIGAQIRGDFFGYINPGNPEAAADMAWRDASISHIKNGIYGEMFASAMIAAAAVCGDRETVVMAGLSQIPEKSRLAEKIMLVIDWYHEGISIYDAAARVHKIYNEYNFHHWCHTISNAMLVAVGILFGDGDFEKSVCPVVQAGFDTDCNGATIGSVIGIMNGAKGIGEKWTKPICGTLRTGVSGYNLVKITDLVKMTLEIIKE